MPKTIAMSVGPGQTANTIVSVTGSGPWLVTTGSALPAGLAIGDFLTQTNGAGANRSWVITQMTPATPAVMVTDTFWLGVGPAASATCTLGTAFPTLTAANTAIAVLYTTGDTCILKLSGLVTESSVTFNTAALGATGTLKIMSMPGQEHRGRVGTGAIWRPDGTVTAGSLMQFNITAQVLVDPFEIDGNGLTATNTLAVVDVYAVAAGSLIDRLIVRRFAGGGKTLDAFKLGTANVTLDNCIAQQGTACTRAFWVTGEKAVPFRNCLAFGWGSQGYRDDGTTATMVNCASFGNTTEVVGTWGETSDYNATDDATAPGTNSLKSLTATVQFINTTTFDLRLKPKSALKRAGLKNATTHSYDITGRIRRIPWDIGPYGFEYRRSLPRVGIVRMSRLARGTGVISI